MTPQLILAVAIGGALGSVARYLVSIGWGKLFGTDFPWGTLIINVTGSFLIGARWPVRSQMGVVAGNAGIPDSRHCGGYTMFSTFSLDAYYLTERGQTLASFAYMVASVALSVGAPIAALRVVRALS
ncbi:fluoride efflux transporter CrcB [Bradyrhizobium sp. CSA112]|uniref:fluoride efflux transporter CrcB n=1 Tax=Bradyrhizobium sp. CSA112 TaxID=2699170 RepID=UPI0023B11BD5|nr:fluoride efflux transporter CrcB [Bradyrhizobium sp. CSA112]MDE5456021.1 fluoride efflux transporter CrcB [Bradyrhizobium sp. CSA112]